MTRQAEYRLHLRLANRHKHVFIRSSYLVGALNLRHALLILRERWTNIAGRGTPCPIELSVEERKVLDRQLWCFERYEGAIEAAQSALGYEGDGLVSHEKKFR